MQIEERRILKNLKTILNNLPDNMSQQDHKFIYAAVNAVITTVTAADEPFHKTEHYYGIAQNIIQQLDSFIQHRKKEDWSAFTDFLYKLTPIDNKHVSH